MHGTNKRYISIPQQKILLIAYNNSKKITFEEQKIYKNRRTFNDAMKQLIDSNWFKIKTERRNNKFGTIYNIYQLTLEGILVIEEIIKPFQEGR